MTGTGETSARHGWAGLFQEFLRLESAGGIVLFGAAVAAMLAANSPLSGYYESFRALPFEIRLGEWGLAKPLVLWINDGLMAVFFLLVGMELKREMLEGHLSSIRQAVLPAIAAAGGMIVPAAVYALTNWGDSVAMRGWAIPAATDIAFALGVLLLLGNRVPVALKAFLLSVAIFDDLGAIAVIALFYTEQLSGAALAAAALLIAVLALLNRSGVARPAAYLLVGVPLWAAVLKSGAHATLAGVILAFFIPARPAGAEADEPGGSLSPLKSLEHALHPWVAFGILPLFAFANAGVQLAGLSVSDLLQPVPLGIALGLTIGKLVGVLAASWVAVRSGLASLPEDVRWPHMVGVSLLCGIGFTMSLFIASLAFDEAELSFNGLDRLGILTGSLAAGVLGYALLRAAPGSKPARS